MLSIRFRPENKYEWSEVEIDPPYELIAHFLSSDIQHHAEGARKLAEIFKRVAGGEEEPFEGEGNAYLMEVGPTNARISTEYGTKPSCELPTAWLIDALEQWAAYVEGKRTA